MLIKLKFRLSVRVSVRNLSPRRGSTAGTHIWYWHKAQCPADVLVRVSFRLVASGPSYGRIKGRRLKNGQKMGQNFFEVIHSKWVLNGSEGWNTLFLTHFNVFWVFLMASKGSKVEKMVKMGDFFHFQISSKWLIGLIYIVFDLLYEAKVLLIGCQREARLPW